MQPFKSNKISQSTSAYLSGQKLCVRFFSSIYKNGPVVAPLVTNAKSHDAVVLLVCLAHPHTAHSQS